MCGFFGGKTADETSFKCDVNGSGHGRTERTLDVWPSDDFFSPLLNRCVVFFFVCLRRLIYVHILRYPGRTSQTQTQWHIFWNDHQNLPSRCVCKCLPKMSLWCLEYCRVGWPLRDHLQCALCDVNMSNGLEISRPRLLSFDPPPC